MSILMSVSIFCQKLEFVNLVMSMLNVKPVQRWPCYITYPVLALQDVGHPDGGPLQKVCDRLEVPVPRRHDVLLHRHQVDQRPPGVVLVCYSVVS